jgi:hypothetical protein
MSTEVLEAVRNRIASINQQRASLSEELDLLILVERVLGAASSGPAPKPQNPGGRAGSGFVLHRLVESLKEGPKTIRELHEILRVQRPNLALGTVSPMLSRLKAQHKVQNENGFWHWKPEGTPP